MKMARPKHRRHTLIFSDNACMCLEDGQLTLQVRIGDIRNSHLIDCHVYGTLVKRYVCQEKYVYPLYQHEIKFEAHGMRNQIFLMWPMVLCHKINTNSPLYSLNPQELHLNHFELILFLQGTIESTGEMLQARTSYTNEEVLWGFRFLQLEEYNDKDGSWYINFDQFNKVEKCLTPDVSAQQLMEKSGKL
ncbi:Inward rectifier potassium channel irk-1 [Bulinus truncatus]|nr:Inward rectifier potassium channel irk-1 [Bulinus truncatus]